jgi:hypothetical protein
MIRVSDSESASEGTMADQILPIWNQLMDLDSRRQRRPLVHTVQYEVQR